jgi:glycosyltransferase involved in cell wall biosynthesis
MMASNRSRTIVAIIPLFNGAEWIEQSVRSVLAQTLQPDEFLVVNDGSTDGGPAIVERLAAEYPLIRLLNKPNGGQSAARNHGVKQSTSDLIAFLDQDDAWYPGHLEELVKPFSERYDLPLGWVYSNVDEADGQRKMVYRNMLSRVPAQHPKRSLFRCLSEDMFVLPSASLISREAFEAVGGFDERLSGYEDDDLFLRLFRASYDNVFIDRPLSVWRIRPDSMSYGIQMARSGMLYARKLFDLFPDDPTMGRYFSRDMIAPRFLKLLLNKYMRASWLKDRDLHRLTVDEIITVLPKLRLRRRIIVRIALPFMRSYSISSAIGRTQLMWIVGRL